MFLTYYFHLTLKTNKILGKFKLKITGILWLTLYMYITFLVSVSSLAAVMMRQTNIIWVGFMMMDEIWNVLTKNKQIKKTQDNKYSIVSNESVTIGMANCNFKFFKLNEKFLLYKKK